MPVYSYSCDKCGETKNLFHSVSEVGTVKNCANCATELRRVYTPFMFGYSNPLGNPSCDSEYARCAFEHKQYIEENKERIRKGELEYIPNKTLPKEFQPNLQK
jgi:putative FmdB family regulatory protein